MEKMCDCVRTFPDILIKTFWSHVPAKCIIKTTIMGQRILYLPNFFSFLRVGVYFTHTPDLPTLSGAISDILIIFQLTDNH